MDQHQKHDIKGYEFHVTGALEKDGRYRGMIILSRRGDTGEALAKPLLIETPSSFKSAHAAQIEASAYAHELIHQGAIAALLPAATGVAGIPSRPSHAVPGLSRSAR